MAAPRSTRAHARRATSDVAAVMALYNGGSLVLEALDSIAAQTYPPKEIIVVDDGSSDSSPKLVSEWAERHAGPSRVTLIHQTNAGQGSARNAGVARAKAAFIAFLDQDDTWPPEHLSVLLEHFRDRADLGWVYSDFGELDERGHPGRRAYLAETAYRVPDATYEAILGQDLMILPSASLIRTRAFRDAGGFDTQFRGYEDDDLFVRIFRAGWTFDFEPRAVSNYRIHAENSSRQSSFIRSRERFYLKYRSEFEAAGEDSGFLFRRIVAERMTRAFINDVVAYNRDKIPGDFHSELIRVATFILGDVGWTWRRRVVMLTVRYPRLVPFALWVTALLNSLSLGRQSRRKRSR